MKLKYNLIILLGGKSNRFNNDINKVYCLINNKPLYLNALDEYLKFDDISKFIIVYNNDDSILVSESLDSYKYHQRRKDIYLTKGGKERYLSVLNGLAVCDKDCDYVIVHDGARPNISYNIIKDAMNEVIISDCVSVGVRMTDTVKKMNHDFKLTTVDRQSLFIMQTPQITKYNLLKDCLDKVKEEDNITDDLMAIEKYSSITPHIVIGDKNNFKITTIEDYNLMKLLMENKNV